MKKIIAIGLLFFVLFCSLGLSGCQRENLRDRQATLSEASEYSKNVELYIREEFKLGKYEPLKGLYTGAYIEDDDSIKGNMKTYETLLGQPQTFKVLQYHASKGIEKEDILKCISEKKIPYIKLILDVDYGLNSVYQLIFDLKATYKLPVFIELYPVTTKPYEPNQYKQAYLRAYELLHKYLEDVTVVWSMDDTRIADLPFYYPGHQAVDWVGINIYIPRYKMGEKYSYNGEESIDFWYKYFQHHKPLMISALAISNYSAVDHTYSVYEVRDRLKYFYHDLLKAYPRIRGILYIDADTLRKHQGKDDYSLTSQKILTKTMQDLSQKLRIKTYLENEPGKAAGYMKYRVRGIYLEDELCLEEAYVKHFFPKLSLRQLQVKKTETGKRYYALNEIRAYSDCYYKA